MRQRRALFSKPVIATAFLIVFSTCSIGEGVPAQAPAAGAGADLAWTLLTDPAGTYEPASLPAEGWRPVRDGLSWNAQFDDLRDYMGVAWYRATLDLPPSQAPRHVLLRFGAVDHLAEVFVNGKSAGRHEGAYTPFTIDATPHVKAGSNEVLVRVTDPPPTPPDGEPRFPEMPYDELPRGKQNWYIQNGGLWQPVTVDIRPSLYIDGIRVTPSNSGAVRVDVDLSGSAPQEVELTVTLTDPDGQPAGRPLTRAVTAAGPVSLETSVSGPRLWSPATPALYGLEIALSGAVDDRQTTRFGFREFTARDGRFFLNGEPFYMIGALDQDFYPESIYSTPDREYVVDMMKKGRALGLNTLRCHIKVCDPVYLEAADEVGMLVWYEVPSWEEWTGESVARGRKIFEAMTRRDWNHPSIVIQTLINEAWGIDMTEAAQREGLLRWFEEARTLVAPLGRLVVDNSPCCDNFHLQTDIDDFHQYFSIPDNAARWDRWVADFASRPAWSFSTHGDARRTGEEPLVVSEFGNWGLPELPGELPWWFPRDFNGREITRPAGLFDRFRDRGFERVFGDYPTLARETQWRQFFSLKHEIESIRAQGALQGYVITEFTDINWEANGLMDMWRRPKAYAEALADIQQPDVLLPSTPQRNYTSGAPVEVTVDLSRFSAADPAGGRLRWTTASGASGTAPVERGVARGEVGRVAAFEFAAPAVTRPTRERISMELTDASGAVLSKNTHDVFVFQEPSAPDASVSLHDPHRALTALAWPPGMAPVGGVLVASTLDAAVREHVAAGGRAIVVAAGLPMAFSGAPQLTAVERRDELDGNWVSNFPWIHVQSPALSGAGVSRVTGFEAGRATPRRLLAGVPEKAWRQGDVLAGMFFGWLNENHATIAQFRLGKGKVLVTTFDTSAYGDDPFTTHLLDGLIRYVASDQCAPATELP